MSNFLSFISGTLFGAYLAQNYKIINIKDYSIILYNYIQSLEKIDNENNENNEKELKYKK